MRPGQPRSGPLVIAALILPGALALAARAWIAALPARWGFESLDRFFLFTPFHDHLGRMLAEGRLPLWNPLLGLGIHEVADPALSPLYPPNLLFALGPVARVEELLTAAHVVLAATAVCLLARRCGLGLAAAATTGALLASASTFHALPAWPSILATFSWTPLAFLAARRLGDDPTAGRSLPLALVLAMQILAGYLQLHLYTVLCLPLFFLPAAGWAAFARPLVWAVAAALLAQGLAAFALLPALTEIAGSWRSRSAVPEILHHIFPVHPYDYALGLVSPDPGFKPRIFGGPFLVPLLVAGVVARGTAPRLRLPALILTAAAVVLSLGDATPIFPALRRLPISHWLTGPYKWTWLAALGAMLIAGVGAHALFRNAPERPFPERTWAVLALLGVLALPAPLLQRVVGAGAVLGLLAVRRMGGMPLRAATLTVPFLVAATALGAHRDRLITPADAPEFFLRYRPAYTYLAGRQGDGQTFIAIGPPAISTRQGEMEGVAQVNTNGVIVSVRLARYLEAAQGAVDRADAARALGLLRALGARFVMTGADAHGWLADSGLERVFRSPAADVWEDPATLPRVHLAAAVERLPADRVLERLGDPAVAATRTVVLEDGGAETGAGTTGTARIVQAGDTRIVVAVDAAAPGILVLLDAWSPHWRARVDGEAAPILRANWLARAVAVPAGRHLVEFRFVPVPFYLGLGISIVTALACAAGGLAIARSARRRAGPPSLASRTPGR